MYDFVERLQRKLNELSAEHGDAKVEINKYVSGVFSLDINDEPIHYFFDVEDMEQWLQDLESQSISQPLIPKT